MSNGMDKRFVSLNEFKNIVSGSEKTALKRYGDSDYYGHILKSGVRIQVVGFIFPPGTVVYDIVGTPKETK